MSKRKGNSREERSNERRLSRGQALSRQVARRVWRDHDVGSLSFGSEYSSVSESEHDMEAMDEDLDDRDRSPCQDISPGRGVEDISDEGLYASAEGKGRSESGWGKSDDAGGSDSQNASGSDSDRNSNSDNDVCREEGEGERLGDEVSSDWSEDSVDECTAAQCREQEQNLHRRQRRALMRRLDRDGHNGLPPMLRCDGQHPMRRVVFALPAFVPATEKRGASLDLKQFTMPGATVVRAIDGSAQYLWFCSCSPENVVIKRTAEALHMMAGGCSDVKSAACECVQYCQAILSTSDVGVGEVIEMSPMHYADDDGGGGQGKSHLLCSCLYFTMLYFSSSV